MNTEMKIMDVFYTIIWIGIIGFIILGMFGIAKMHDTNEIQKQNVQNDLKSIPFQLDKKYEYFNVLNLPNNLFGINKKEKKLLFYDYYTQPKFTTYNFSSIIDVKKIIDDETISTSSSGSTIGRALIGGVLAGGVGAVIGGVTGKKNGTQAINSLELEIVINDIEYPSYRIPFFVSPKPKEIKFDETLEKADKEINEWLNIFKVILYQNEHPSNDKDVMN
jgi:hypothetical protein